MLRSIYRDRNIVCFQAAISGLGILRVKKRIVSLEFQMENACGGAGWVCSKMTENREHTIEATTLAVLAVRLLVRLACLLAASAWLRQAHGLSSRPRVHHAHTPPTTSAPATPKHIQRQNLILFASSSWPSQFHVKKYREHDIVLESRKRASKLQWFLARSRPRSRRSRWRPSTGSWPWRGSS